jgi:MFS family permease
LGPQFARLLTASTVSNVGDGLIVAALPLAAIEVTDSPLLVAGIVFARGIPWLVFGLTAGVIVDRTDRRRLMALVDFGRAAIIGALGVAMLVSDVPIAVLYLVALGLGAGEVLFDSASSAFIPMLVPDEHLERANSRLYLSLTVANELSGPAAGAWLFAAAASAPFLFDAATFVFAAAMVLAIRGTWRVEPGSARAVSFDDYLPRASVRSAVREGLRYVRGHPLLRALAITGAGYNFLATGLEAVAVLYIREELGASTRVYGLILTLAAVGGLAGGALAPRIYQRFAAGPVIVIDVLVCAAAALVAAAVGNLVAWTLFDMLLFGGSAIASIGSQSMRQRAMPPELAGRISSLFLLALFGAGPLGAAAFGALTAATSLTAALVAFGAGATALMALTAPRLLAAAGR